MQQQKTQKISIVFCIKIFRKFTQATKYFHTRWIKVKLAFKSQHLIRIFSQAYKKGWNLTNFSGVILLLNLISSINQTIIKFLLMLSLLNLRVITLSCIISQFPVLRFSCESTPEHSQMNYCRNKNIFSDHGRNSRLKGEKKESRRSRFKSL